jgi:1-phosphofructokinase family hexose kinase
MRNNVLKNRFKIITIGLSPAWDIRCSGKNIEWGVHSLIDSTCIQPAGKALNISKALAWMGRSSIAAGLWGRDDYDQMAGVLRSEFKKIKIELTAVERGTRRNITVVDMARRREMHLRAKSELVSKDSLKKLKSDLSMIVGRNSVCVFAGMMAETKFLDEIIGLIELCRNRGAKIVLDTWGRALREIIDTGLVWLVKPNVEELSGLLNHRIRNEPGSLVKAGRTLLDKVELVLISRAEKGALVIMDSGVWQGRRVGRRRVLSTVGCGDYLLAGFLSGLQNKSRIGHALETALKVATAKAWDLTEKQKWSQIKQQIKIVM